jgi:zinc protease
MTRARGAGILSLFGMATLLLLASVVAAYAGEPALGDPRKMTFAPVEFSPPDPERVVLDNGMVVYLLEDHELPLITITASMRTGGWLDPADKVGLAAMTGSVMRTGGGGGPWWPCGSPPSAPAWA